MIVSLCNNLSKYRYILKEYFATVLIIFPEVFSLWSDPDIDYQTNFHKQPEVVVFVWSSYHEHISRTSNEVVKVSEWVTRAHVKLPSYSFLLQYWKMKSCWTFVLTAVRGLLYIWTFIYSLRALSNQTVPHQASERWKKRKLTKIFFHKQPLTFQMLWAYISGKL